MSNFPRLILIVIFVITVVAFLLVLQSASVTGKSVQAAKPCLSLCGLFIADSDTTSTSSSSTGSAYY